MAAVAIAAAQPSHFPAIAKGLGLSDVVAFINATKLEAIGIPAIT